MILAILVLLAPLVLLELPVPRVLLGLLALQEPLVTRVQLVPQA